jgi:hypothetical protein
MNTAELRGPKFAELTALYLKASGIAGARTRPRQKLSEAVLDDDASSADVQGVGDFHIVTKAGFSMAAHLSVTLDQVESHARAEGKSWPVLVWYRRERPAPQSYAIMTLSTLTSIIAEFQNREVA